MYETGCVPGKLFAGFQFSVCKRLSCKSKTLWGQEMSQIDKYELEKLIRDGEKTFSYRIEPNVISKIQLYFTGRVTKGIELFGIRPLELRALGFLFKYKNEINLAINNSYRVFVKKEGKYFGQGSWNLEFVKKIKGT